MVAAVRVLVRIAPVIEEARRKKVAPTRDAIFSTARIIAEHGIRVEIMENENDPGDPAFAESPGPSRFFDLERTAFGDPARRESTRAKQTGRRQLHHDVHSHATGDSIYV